MWRRMDDTFMSYVQEYQHWIFLKHNEKGCVVRNSLIIDNPRWDMSSQEKSFAIIVIEYWPYAATYVISSYLVQAKYMSSSKDISLCLSTISERTKGLHHVFVASQWLPNNWGNGGETPFGLLHGPNTFVCYYLAQDSDWCLAKGEIGVV